MPESHTPTDHELSRLCELLDRAATPERRTDVAIRICDALNVPCGRNP
jgi:hypothetical protein